MSKITIGVAIPCYKKHIPRLFDLLDSIELQTRKPDKVVVSCSSTTKEEFPYEKIDYSYPILIQVTNEKKNAAQNRNIAGKHLHTDILSFMDADDVMHPQRLEIVEKVFLDNPNVKIFLHGYQFDKTFEKYDSIMIKRGRLSKCFWGSTICLDTDMKYLIHNSQPSIPKSIFEIIQFPEENEFFGKEDTIFCTSVITKYQSDTAYLPNSLSYYNQSQSYQNSKSDNVIVLITDKHYRDVMVRTLKDIRTVGKWVEDIVVITIDFILDNKIKKDFKVINVQFPIINKTTLVEKIKQGYENSDKRELLKLSQWEKIHVFDDYFKMWKKVIYFDSGLRILDDIKYFNELNCKNSIIAPNDKGYYRNIERQFQSQVEMVRKDEIQKLVDEFGKEILEKDYFLNCLWIYDTSILDIVKKEEMIEYMNKYPIWRTNEMGVMNLVLHFKHKLWKEMPLNATNGKYLFEWCELNHKFPTIWKQYCAIKYPVTIKLNQDPIL